MPFLCYFFVPLSPRPHCVPAQCYHASHTVCSYLVFVRRGDFSALSFLSLRDNRIGGDQDQDRGQEKETEYDHEPIVRLDLRYPRGPALTAEQKAMLGQDPSTFDPHSVMTVERAKLGSLRT